MKFMGKLLHRLPFLKRVHDVQAYSKSVSVKALIETDKAECVIREVVDQVRPRENGHDRSKEPR